MTPADEDANSMQTDDVNRAILGNVAIHMRECNDFFWFLSHSICIAQLEGLHYKGKKYDILF